MAVNLNDNSNNANNNNSNNTGTGYTNVNSYLNANKNNNLASTVQKGVQGVTDKTQQQTQKSQDQFNNSLGTAVQDIKAGNQFVGSNGNSGALNGLDFSNEQNSQAAQNALSNLSGIDPSTGTSYAQETANIRQGYQGQQGLDNSDQLHSQAQDLNQVGQNLNSASGRQAALQRFVNAGPNYTSNKQQLDNLLLGQNTQALNDARRNALTQAGSTNQAVNNAQNQANFYSQQYQTLNPQIQNALGSAANSLTNTLTGRVNANTTQANTDIGTLKNDIASKTLNPSEMSYLQSILGTNQLGNFTPQDLQTIVDANVSQYNPSSVANQGEYSAAQTLAKLAGGGLGLPSFNSNQIGTAKTGGLANEATINNPTLDNFNNQLKDTQTNLANFKFQPANQSESELFNGTPNYQQAGALVNNQAVQQYQQLQSKIVGNGLTPGGNAKTPELQAADSYYYGTVIPALQQMQQQGLINKGFDLNNPMIAQSTLAGINNLSSQYNNLNSANGVGNTLATLQPEAQQKAQTGKSIGHASTALRRLANNS